MGEMEVKADKKPYWETMDYRASNMIIKANLKNGCRAVIAMGYYLKHIRENRLYKDGGYKSFGEYVKTECGLSESAASRSISQMEKFSEGGNSPKLAKKWEDFSISKLQEILYLTDEQRETVTPDMTVKEIREIRRPAAQGADGPVQPEPLSILGFPKKVYPEGSLIASEGCAGNDCFLCAYHDCPIRGKDRDCRFEEGRGRAACETLKKMEGRGYDAGSGCQFINLDLAKKRIYGDGQPIPCCQSCSRTECKDRCAKARGKDAGADPMREEPERLPAQPLAAVVIEGAVEDMLPDAPELDAPEPEEAGPARCVTGRSENGFCGAAAYCTEAVSCCTNCSKDCNGRCGWLTKKEADKQEESLATSQESLTEQYYAGRISKEELWNGQAVGTLEASQEGKDRRDAEWFVKQYLEHSGKNDLPHLMRICRKEIPKSEKIKEIKGQIGYRGGGNGEFGYDFGSYSQGVCFDADNRSIGIQMTYNQFLDVLLRLYNPHSPEWDEPLATSQEIEMQADIQRPEEDGASILSEREANPAENESNTPEPEQNDPESEQEVPVYDKGILLEMIEEVESFLNNMDDDWRRETPAWFTRQAMSLEAYHLLLDKHEAREEIEKTTTVCCGAEECLHRTPDGNCGCGVLWINEDGTCEDMACKDEWEEEE